MHAVFELEEVSSRPPLACQPGLIRISCTEEKRILIYYHITCLRRPPAKIEWAQVIHYLRATRIPYALLINFGRSEIQYETFDLANLPSI